MNVPKKVFFRYVCIGSHTITLAMREATVEEKASRMSALQIWAPIEAADRIIKLGWSAYIPIPDDMSGICIDGPFNKKDGRAAALERLNDKEHALFFRPRDNEVLSLAAVRILRNHFKNRQFRELTTRRKLKQNTKRLNGSLIRSGRRPLESGDAAEPRADTLERI